MRLFTRQLQLSKRRSVQFMCRELALRLLLNTTCKYTGRVSVADRQGHSPLQPELVCTSSAAAIQAKPPSHLCQSSSHKQLSYGKSISAQRPACTRTDRGIRARMPGFATCCRSTRRHVARWINGTVKSPSPQLTTTTLRHQPLK